MGLAEITLAELLDGLGARTPAPGGGAVAGITASLAAALGQMVVRYSQRRGVTEEDAALFERALRALTDLASAGLAQADADARAYAHLSDVSKRRTEEAPHREEYAEAVRGAIAAPQAVLTGCMTLLRVLEDLCGRTNPALDSDVAIAAHLAETAASAAAWNLRVNLTLLEDGQERQRLEAETATSLDTAGSIARGIRHDCLHKD